MSHKKQLTNKKMLATKMENPETITGQESLIEFWQELI